MRLGGCRGYAGGGSSWRNGWAVGRLWARSDLRIDATRC